MATARMVRMVTAMRFRLLLPLLAVAPALGAAPVAEFGTDIGVGRTDNITRVSTNKRSETISNVGAQFSVLQETQRLSADITGNLAWFDYANNTYDSELVGSVAAATRLRMLEDRLTWSIDDNFGQTRRDLFSVDTPANRQDVNYFSTGPGLRLGLGSATYLVAQARYALVDYSKSPSDSRRESGSLAVEHDLSQGSRVGLEVNNEHVAPRGSAAFASYDRSEAYLQYGLRGARTVASVAVGASRLDQVAGRDTGLLLRAEVSRKVSLSNFSIRIGREITDPGDSQRLRSGAQLPAATLNTQSLSPTATPYVNEYAQFDWRITGHRTSLGFGADLANENYLGSALQDRRRSGFHASATREIASRLRADAGLRFSKYDFRHTAGDNSEKAADLGLSWQFGRKAALELAGNYSKYTSDSVAPDSSEMRYWLKLRFGDRITRGQ